MGRVSRTKERTLKNPNPERSFPEAANRSQWQIPVTRSGSILSAGSRISAVICSSSLQTNIAILPNIHFQLYTA